jgi:hypothetical protein
MARLLRLSALAVGALLAAGPALAGVVTINYAITGGTFTSTASGAIPVLGGIAVGKVGNAASLFAVPSVGAPISVTVDATNNTLVSFPFTAACPAAPRCHFMFTGVGSLTLVNTLGAVGPIAGAASLYRPYVGWGPLGAASGLAGAYFTGMGGFVASGFNGLIGAWSIYVQGQEVGRSFAPTAPEPAAAVLIGLACVALSRLGVLRSAHKE